LPAAGVDLGLDDAQLGAQGLVGLDGLLDAAAFLPPGDGQAGGAEELLGLELVDLHDGVGLLVKRSGGLGEVGRRTRGEDSSRRPMARKGAAGLLLPPSRLESAP